MKLAGDDTRLGQAMDWLYGQFEDAPTLGSLIDPAGYEGDAVRAGFDEVQPILQKALMQLVSDLSNQVQM